ncbi:unnamed protein product [Gongylonema pulchrum]|uniref:Mediator of RNA polymerase II transcription subunit 25 n=1 Tax=Gongylonema pulchrum TaxID=637853 RepID=A0A183DYN1_9BILA|nr:unnamed protein product [Gongylonema pulchrum]
MSSGISDKDVADVLNAIDGVGNSTMQPHRVAKPVPLSSLAIINDPQCNNSDLKSILQEVCNLHFLRTC